MEQVVNGGVHTAYKQHQRVCMQMCLRILWTGPHVVTDCRYISRKKKKKAEQFLIRVRHFSMVKDVCFCLVKRPNLNWNKGAWRSRSCSEGVPDLLCWASGQYQRPAARNNDGTNYMIRQRRMSRLLKRVTHAHGSQDCHLRTRQKEKSIQCFQFVSCQSGNPWNDILMTDFNTSSTSGKTGVLSFREQSLPPPNYRRMKEGTTWKVTITLLIIRSLRCKQPCTLNFHLCKISKSPLQKYLVEAFNTPDTIYCTCV